MTEEATVKIYVTGHADDLYAFAILYPEGVYPGLAVHTSIIGKKDGVGDRVVDASKTETFVTGAGCLAVLDARSPDEGEWIATAILSPLNGYAVLAESNFKPVRPVSIAVREHSGARVIAFGSTPRPPGTRLVTTARTPLLRDALSSRVGLMSSNPIAVQAALVVAGPPSWSEYYRILEDVAGACGTTIGQLHTTGFTTKGQLTEFTKAANNRSFGRHGLSNRNASLPQHELMNLLEAREYVRTVVSAWFDKECGGRMPRDRVDGGALRFGLEGRSDP